MGFGVNYFLAIGGTPFSFSRGVSSTIQSQQFYKNPFALNASVTHDSYMGSLAPSSAIAYLNQLQSGQNIQAQSVGNPINPDSYARQLYVKAYGEEKASSADIETIREYARGVLGGNPVKSVAKNSDVMRAKQMLAGYGIPDEIIEKGDDAIRQYAQDNGINIPAKS